ncbi:hypothetical protein PLCT2_01945 [Planctomycetaceae bacterium]|nr:hypothetical protein PLCT2_01945 [Planctomycetaceae bacterium]
MRGIVEGIDGRDMVNRGQLGAFEQQAHFILGAAQLASLVLPVAKAGSALVKGGAATTERAVATQVERGVCKLPKITCFTSGTLVAVAGGFKPIEDIRVGNRVESTDGTHDLTEIDEATWKHVVVRMDNPDGSDDILEIELLRSPQWIEETGSRVGGSIGLAIPEMGIYGWAKVIALNPCPKLQTGAGRVVTMTITHFNAFVLRFKIEGLPEVLEPTILHPLYSEDRGEWVHAGELKVGERLPFVSLSVQRRRQWDARGSPGGDQGADQAYGQCHGTSADHGYVVDHQSQRAACQPR